MPEGEKPPVQGKLHGMPEPTRESLYKSDARRVQAGEEHRVIPHVGILDIQQTLDERPENPNFIPMGTLAIVDGKYVRIMADVGRTEQNAFEVITDKRGNAKTRNVGQRNPLKMTTVKVELSTIPVQYLTERQFRVLLRDREYIKKIRKQKYEFRGEIRTVTASPLDLERGGMIIYMNPMFLTPKQNLP